VSVLALEHAAPMWHVTPAASNGGGADEHAAKVHVAIAQTMDLMRGRIFSTHDRSERPELVLR